MGLIATYANLTWRDWNTDGLPSSGVFKTVKSDVRSTLAVVENIVVSGISGAAGAPVAYAARATLFADLAHAAGVLGVVYNDATPANNGYYAKTGSSGSGAWSLTGLALPSTFATDLASVMAQLENIAAAAVSAADADAAAAAAAGSAIASANSALSASNYALSASASAALATSYITATATQFSALVHNDLVTAQGAANSAGTSAASAASSAALALTAANNSGPYYKIYTTKAAATADLSNITANSFVIVEGDESQNGAKTEYQKVSGSLVFQRRQSTDVSIYPENYGVQYGNTGIDNLTAFQAAVAAGQTTGLPVYVNGDMSTSPGLDLQPDPTKAAASLIGRPGAVIRYTGTGTSYAEIGLKASIPSVTGNVDSGATLKLSGSLGDTVLVVTSIANFGVGCLITVQATGVYIPTVSRQRTSNVATVETDYAHFLTTGVATQVQGLTGAPYNGASVTPTVVDATHFTYASVGSDEAKTQDNGGGVVAPYNHSYLAEVVGIEGGGAATIGVSSGALSTLTITTPGTYKSVPSIVASGGGGSGGVIAAVLGALTVDYDGNGLDYLSGDVITLGNGSSGSPGTFTTAAQITIDEAIGGIPTKWHVSRAGAYTALPPDFVAQSSSTASSIGITQRARASNVATLTVASTANLAVGGFVTVAASGDSSFSGRVQVASIVDATHFTYASAGSNVSATSDSGTISRGTGAIWNVAWQLVGGNITSAGSGYTAPAAVISGNKLYLDRPLPWTLLSTTAHTIFVIAAATVIRDQVIDDIVIRYDGPADRPAVYPLYAFGMSRCRIRIKALNFPFGSTIALDHMHNCDIEVTTDALIILQNSTGCQTKLTAHRGKYFGILINECADIDMFLDAGAETSGRGIKLNGCQRLTGLIRAYTAPNTAVDVEYNCADWDISAVIGGSTNPGSPIATGFQFNGSGNHDIKIDGLAATGNFSAGALFYVSAGDSRVTVDGFSGSAPNFSILGKDCSVRPVAPVLARIYRAANQSLSGLVTALFDSESWDTYNCWNSNTFTCLFPGYYRVRVRVSVTGAWPSSPTVTLIIYVNGVAFDSEILLGPENDEYIQAEDTVKLNVNDTVVFGIALSSSSATMLGGTSNSFATIEQI